MTRFDMLMLRMGPSIAHFIPSGVAALDSSGDPGMGIDIGGVPRGVHVRRRHNSSSELFAAAMSPPQLYGAPMSPPPRARGGVDDALVALRIALEGVQVGLACSVEDVCLPRASPFAIAKQVALQRLESGPPLESAGLGRHPDSDLPHASVRGARHHDVDAPRSLNALQQAFTDFAMPVEAMLSAAESLRQTLGAAKGRVNIALAQVRWGCGLAAVHVRTCVAAALRVQKRNTILRFGIQIQLVAAAFAACSVVSGWFGERPASWGILSCCQPLEGRLYGVQV